METLKFDQVYLTHKEKVLKYVKVKVYPHIECAEEILDDIFMKVYQNLITYDSTKSNISTWIFTITNNTLIDYFRSIKQEQAKVNFLDYKHYTDVMYNLNSDNTSDGDIMYNESIVRIKKAINSMDETMQTVADLRFIKEYKYKDIANELDMPINTVKTHITRAKDFIIKYVEMY